MRGWLAQQNGDGEAAQLHQDIVTALLEEAASRRDSGDNPLSLPDLAQVLRQCLERGLSVTQPDSNGAAPLPALPTATLTCVAFVQITVL